MGASTNYGRAHVWKLTAKQPINDRYRTYACERCGAGPVQKDILNGKGSIAGEAKRQGYSTDCNIEITKKIMEE